MLICKLICACGGGCGCVCSGGGGGFWVCSLRMSQDLSLRTTATEATAGPPWMCVFLPAVV